jgi:hypothetical protein
MRKIIVLLVLFLAMVLQGCTTATLYYPDGKIHKQVKGLFKAEITE